MKQCGNSYAETKELSQNDTVIMCCNYMLYTLLQPSHERIHAHTTHLHKHTQHITYFYNTFFQELMVESDNTIFNKMYKEKKSVLTVLGLFFRV